MFDEKYIMEMIKDFTAKAGNKPNYLYCSPDIGVLLPASINGLSVNIRMDMPSNKVIITRDIIEKPESKIKKKGN